MADTLHTPDLAAKALEIHSRLCREYGCPIAYFHDHDPLSELISSLLSHRTRNRDSGRAFAALRARYPSWEALRDAPTAEVERLIDGVTWPEQKAPRIQSVLRAIEVLRGALDLDFLAELPVPEARAWLEAIPGVGPIVAAGWLIATLTGAGVGAAAGSLLGSLTGAGVSEADAHVHAEGVRRGGTVVTVRAEQSEGARIEAILDGRTPVDLATRRTEYETEGWSKNDASAAPYTAEQVTTERKRRVVSVR